VDQTVENERVTRGAVIISVRFTALSQNFDMKGKNPRDEVNNMAKVGVLLL
jgi:hypothetical protein